MNKKHLLSLLTPYTLTENISEDIDIRELDWKVQNDKKEVLLFLKYTENLAKLIKQKKLLATIVTTHDLGQKNQIIIKKDDWMQAQKILCDHFYPRDTESFVIGITGTNGKTSTAFFVSELLEQNNIRTATVGTLGLVDGANQKTIKNFSLTTPSFIDIRKILSHQYGKFQAYVFEASSHALEQERFYEIEFDSAAWTSFSQDHLDYHKTMDDYFQAKLIIFKKLKQNKKLVLSKDEKELFIKVNQFKKNIFLSHYSKDYKNPIFSVSFNKANFDVAVGVVNALVEKAIINEEKIKSPPGRFQVIKKDNKEIVLDFAHTPAALENVLKAIKKASDKKILTIFGCGGDRDPMKRPLMGRVAEKYSDVLIITSDNPRFENPQKIINDIESGLNYQKEIHSEIDRKKAIEFALKNFDDHIILVAGKGHENYLDIKGIKYPYSDLEEIKRWI